MHLYSYKCMAKIAYDHHSNGSLMNSWTAIVVVTVRIFSAFILTEIWARRESGHHFQRTCLI